MSPPALSAAADPERRPLRISGEPGLEKDILAALIHFGSSDRRQLLVRLDGAILLPDHAFWTTSRSPRLRFDIWRWKPALRDRFKVWAVLLRVGLLAGAGRWLVPVVWMSPGCLSPLDGMGSVQGVRHNRCRSLLR